MHSPVGRPWRWDIARRALAWLVPAAGLTVAWILVEDPADWVPFALVALLTLPLAVIGGVRLRALLSVLGLVGIACVTTGSSPLDVPAILGDGLRRAAELGAPFDPGSEPALHELVIITVFVLAAGVALTVAARRPLAAGAVAIVAVGYPATLHERHTFALGLVAAISALWPSVVLRARSPRRFAVGVAFVIAAVAASVALGHVGLAPDRASLDWQGWSPLGGDRAGETIRTVWSSDYRGIKFPKKATVVLRIRAPHRLLYWRASTLDLFTDDRWVESLFPVQTGSATRVLAPDPLLPTRGQTVRQDVTVEGYSDDRLPALSQPVAISTRSAAKIFEFSGGVLLTPQGIARGSRYTVWSQAPRPTPRELAGAGTALPAEVGRYLELGRTRFAPFGTPGRDEAARAHFDPELHPEIADYAPLWRKARALTRKSPSPYEATIAVESWLRATGGFTYTESPPAPPIGVPALVDFAMHTKLGYCQHYAGTMALMLRTLGIPSRVAVGFTSGRWKDGEWVVTDHEAHAWVEVWFPGFGWLPFDPTPGRGTLSADYTIASDSADAVRALGTGRFLQPDAIPSTTAPRVAVSTAPTDSGSSSAALWLLAPTALFGLGLASILLLKGLRRRRRFKTGDPRALATAARVELVDLLRDNGIIVSRRASVAELRVELRRLGVDATAFEAVVSAARYARLGDAQRVAPEIELRFDGIRRALRDRRGPLASLRASLAVRSLRRA